MLLYVRADFFASRGVRDRIEHKIASHELRFLFNVGAAHERTDGTGVGPTAIGTVISVTKAYVTRVGGGPFPTEIHDAAGDALRARGHEYGAVTGRPRRSGWLDIPLLRYSNQVNGAEWLVVTKLDVLDDLEEIPVCIGYEINGKVTDEIPADVAGLESIKPRYTSMKGWRQSTEGIAEFDNCRRPPATTLTFRSAKAARGSAWSPQALTATRPWCCRRLPRR